MDLNKMFKPTENQIILSEINEDSYYTKDLKRYMEYGSASGSVQILKAMRNFDNITCKEFYEVYVQHTRAIKDKDAIVEYTLRLLED